MPQYPYPYTRGNPPPLESSPYHSAGVPQIVQPPSGSASQALSTLGVLAALQAGSYLSSLSSKKTPSLPPGTPHKSGKKKKPKKPTKKKQPLDPRIRRSTQTSTKIQMRRGRSYTKTMRKRKRSRRRKRKPALPLKLFKRLMRASRQAPQDWNLYTAQRYFFESASVNGCQVQAHSHQFYIDENTNVRSSEALALNNLMNQGFKQMTISNPETPNAESKYSQRTMIFKNAKSIYRIRNNTNTDCEIWLWTCQYKYTGSDSFTQISDWNTDVVTHGDKITDNTWYAPTLNRENRKHFRFYNLKKFKLIPGQEIQYTIRGIGPSFKATQFSKDPTKVFQRGRKCLIIRLHGAIATGDFGEPPQTRIGMTEAKVDIRHYFQVQYKLLSNSTMIYNHEYRPPIEPADTNLLASGLDTVTEVFSDAAG